MLLYLPRWRLGSVRASQRSQWPSLPWEPQADPHTPEDGGSHEVPHPVSPRRFYLGSQNDP